MLRTLIVGAVVSSSQVPPLRIGGSFARPTKNVSLLILSPPGKDITKIGKDSYKTAEEAEADAKKLCKEPTLAPKLDSDED